MQSRKITQNSSGLSRLAAAFGVLGLAGGAAAFGLGCKRITTIEDHHSVYGLPEVIRNLGDIVVLKKNDAESEPVLAEWQLAPCSSPLFKTFMIQIPFPVGNYQIYPFGSGYFMGYHRFSMRSTMKPAMKFLDQHNIPKSFLATTNVMFDLPVLNGFIHRTAKISGDEQIGKKKLKAAISSLRGVVALQAFSDVEKRNDLGTNLKNMSQAGTNGLPQNLIAALFRTPHYALVLDPANLSDGDFDNGETIISEIEDWGKHPRQVLDDLMTRLYEIELPDYMTGLENALQFINALSVDKSAQRLVRQEQTITVIKEIIVRIESALDRNKHFKKQTKENQCVVRKDKVIEFTFFLADPRLEKPINELAKRRETMINPAGSNASEGTSVPSAGECEDRLELDATAINDFLGEVHKLDSPE